MADSLCRQGHLVLGAEGGEVTDAGIAWLARFGVDLEAARQRRRIFCRPCLDWTERRPHLGGSVGAALAARLFDLGWIERMRESRALVVTAKGCHGLQEVFGLKL